MATMEQLHMNESPGMVPAGLEYGPMLEGGRLSAGLDYYKPTMSQLEHEYEPNVEATFTFRNRGEQRLLDYVDLDALQARFDGIRARGWNRDELDYLSTIRKDDGSPVFGSEYLEYLETNPLPPLEITHDETTDDLAIETTGSLALATFWETIVMSEVNEAYFEGYLRAHDLNPLDVYEEGKRRLDEKIAILQANPDIKFADFGTRRHFSMRWQKYVVGRLVAECPENFVGTSNVTLAEGFDVPPIGTFAHELPMVYAGLADARGKNIRASHNQLLQDWFEFYDEGYSIVLTDTFKTKFFFSDFTPEQAASWRGVRHDSGDPYEFGEQLIAFYEHVGIDPMMKVVNFTDALDINKMVALQAHFGNRVQVRFGLGTNLTNDLGIKALNVVMKVTHVRDIKTDSEADTVKLSDDAGKHTGPPELAEEYEEHHFAVEEGALSGV